MILLEIADLTVHYGKAEVLKATSHRGDEGKIITPYGINSAGKTMSLPTLSSFLVVEQRAVLPSELTLEQRFS